MAFVVGPCDIESVKPKAIVLYHISKGSLGKYSIGIPVLYCKHDLHGWYGEICQLREESAGNPVRVLQNLILLSFAEGTGGKRLVKDLNSFNYITET